MEKCTTANKKLIQLENTMLKIASEMKIGHTILVISIKLNGDQFYRFLESGGYIGFMHNSSATALLDADGLYRIYTPEDIAAYAEEKGDKGMFLVNPHC